MWHVTHCLCLMVYGLYLARCLLMACCCHMGDIFLLQKKGMSSKETQAGLISGPAWTELSSRRPSARCSLVRAIPDMCMDWKKISLRAYISLHWPMNVSPVAYGNLSKSKILSPRMSLEVKMACLVRGAQSFPVSHIPMKAMAAQCPKKGIVCI